MTDYWIVTSSQNDQPPLHTDEDCRMLELARSYRETDREQYPDREICSNCSDDWTPYDGDEERYPCDECGRVFESKGGRSRHVLREHPEAVEAALNGGEVPA